MEERERCVSAWVTHLKISPIFLCSVLSAGLRWPVSQSFSWSRLEAAGVQGRPADVTASTPCCQGASEPTVLIQDGWSSRKRRREVRCSTQSWDSYSNCNCTGLKQNGCLLLTAERCCELLKVPVEQREKLLAAAATSVNTSCSDGDIDWLIGWLIDWCWRTWHHTSYNCVFVCSNTYKLRFIQESSTFFIIFQEIKTLKILFKNKDKMSFWLLMVQILV